MQHLRNDQPVILPRLANLTGHKPIVVLVNGETRSAAEILAGALRDTRGARIVGEKTFGKGIVQSVWTFDDGTSMKVASARYFIPSGKCIHQEGIHPNLEVANSAVDHDRQLVAALGLVGESIVSPLHIASRR